MAVNFDRSALPELPFPPERIPAVIVGFLVFVLVIVGAITSVYTVQPEERAVVKRFGAVIGVTDPGLRVRLPYGIDRKQIVATERVLKEEFGFRTEGQRVGGRTRYSEKPFEDESLMLTGDLNIIDLEWVVQYRINDPILYLYEVREATRTLRDISESVMRRVVGNRLGSDVLTIARVEIQEQARQEMQSIMDRYKSGIHIITVELQDVVPPARVQPAFNEVNEARQERERTINEAQKRVNQELPRAQGAALRIVAEAEGYATERVNRALGESARFQAMLAEYRSAPAVTRTRLHLEAMSSLLPRVDRILVVQDGQIGPLPHLDIGRTEPAEGGRP